MQWIVFCLFLVWTVLFGAFFVLLFPESSSRVNRLFYEQREEDVSVPGEDPGVLPEPPAYMKDYPEVTMSPTPTPAPSFPLMLPPPPTSTPAPEKDEIVPLNGSAPVQIEIKGTNELPKSPDALKQELDKKLQVALENRLIRILVKINIAACNDCSRDDKRLILQLKMMQALLDGKPDVAFKYSKELNKYVKNKKGVWLGDPPRSENSPKIPNSQN